MNRILFVRRGVKNFKFYKECMSSLTLLPFLKANFSSNITPKEPKRSPITKFHKRSLLRLSITCGLLNSKLNLQMRFSLPSIECSAAPPSFRLCCLNCAQRFDYRALSNNPKLGGAAEHLIDGSEKRAYGWVLNFRVRMLLKGAVNVSTQLVSSVMHRVNSLNVASVTTKDKTSCSNTKSRFSVKPKS